MKSRLNLSIEKDLLEKIKIHADSAQTTVSKLVEVYFKRLVSSPHNESIVDVIENLERPQIDLTLDLKAAFYERSK